jgi:hypothetical protein
MRNLILATLASLLLSSNLFASADKVTQELTLLNIGNQIQKTLKVYHSACNALVDNNFNKVINQTIINQPKPISIARPKRAVPNEIKPIFPGRPKRAIENEIKPIFPGRPKSVELVDCKSFQKELALSLYTKVEKMIESEGLNINEMSEVIDFVSKLQENMQNPNNEDALLALLNTKRIYNGLELIELILDNGLVPPAKLFNINTFVTKFSQTVTK